MGPVRQRRPRTGFHSMTPDEEKTLALLLKKQEEEKQGAPVLRLVPGGSEKNAMADKISEFAAMARRGELFDYAIIVVKADGVSSQGAWGSPVPSLQICGALSAFNLTVLTALQRS